jgi:hypothetical protein
MLAFQQDHTKMPDKKPRGRPRREPEFPLEFWIIANGGRCACLPPT